MANWLNVVRRIAVAACMAAAFAACAATGEGNAKAKWRILDPTTSPPSPVPGALILATYRQRSALPGFQDTVCVGIELATSDGDGRFELRDTSVMPDIVAHKSGYAQPWDRSSSHAKERWVLLASNPGYEGRVTHFRQVYNESLCEYKDMSQVEIFLDSVLPELRAIARTPDAVEILRNTESYRERLRRSK